ncbi:MAG: GNAT family N-acetyltransferase [Anaerolineae bacterium]|jgi:GNAT superfamily N-acetyltransferase|nr:GNAT family N-acetyltransferase [Anaerolineae bacterium]
MTLDFRLATVDDAPLLAHMNQQLIVDEASRNPMTLAQLEERMARWLAGEYQAVLFFKEGQVVGYLLFRPSRDEYYPYQPNMYIRQFFIERSFRRRGIGQVAFEMAAARVFPPHSTLALDVLETNPEARQFWLKLGFEVYATALRRLPPE